MFDDGDVDYVGSMLTSALDDETPTDDNEVTHSLRGRPSLADGSVPPQTRNHMFESDLPTMPPPDALNLSLGEVTPSILGDVSLSDSEVAFADRLGTDLDDDTFLTHSARLRRADALAADIFGDDSSSHSLHASSEGDVDDSEAFSLGELGSNEFSLPPDLDRSLDADQANIFGPLSTHEVTMRVRRKAALPWRRAALGAIVVGATGLGVGLALMDDTPAPAPTAVHAAAAPAKGASAPQSVAEIEGALAAKAPTAAPSSPKEVPAIVVASAPQEAAKEAAKTETHTSAVAPKPTAVDVDAAPKASPKATAPLISKGKVIVPVEGGRVLKKFALENPTRLVVDIEGGHFFGHNMDVHAEGVARIRYGHPTPEVARFVVELEADQRAHALAVKHDDGSLTVGWKTR